MMNLFIFRLSTMNLQSIYDFYYYYFRFCFSFQAYSQALAWSPHQNFSLGHPTSPEGAAWSRSDSCALSQALPRCPSDLSVCPVPLAIHQSLPLSPGPSHRLSPAHTHTPWNTLFFLLYSLMSSSPFRSQLKLLFHRDPSLLSLNKISYLNALIVSCSSLQSSCYTCFLKFICMTFF